MDQNDHDKFFVDAMRAFQDAGYALVAWNGARRCGRTAAGVLAVVEMMLKRHEGSPGVDAERREDMSPRGRLRLWAQVDGDMCITVVDDDGTQACIEFCASGGKSPHTLQALRDLSHAMQRDNVERPLPKSPFLGEMK